MAPVPMPTFKAVAAKPASVILISLASKSSTRRLGENAKRILSESETSWTDLTS